MTSLPIPVHLGVHLLGLTVALGLAAHAVSRRRSAGPGWLALTVGALLLAVSHVATGALLAEGLAWPLYLRVGGYAALALGAAGRLAGTGAVVVVGSPSVHIAAAAAGLMAAVAAARGVLGRGREVLPLAVGLAGWGASDFLARIDLPAAAVLSVAGSLAAGWWLFRRARQSLLRRFMGSFVLVLLVLAVGLAAASGVVFTRDLEGDELARLGELGAASADQIAEDWPRELTGNAATLAGPRLAEELADVRAGRRDALDGRARSLTDLPRVDVAMLVDDAGRVVGSWDGIAGEEMAPAEEAVLAGDALVTRAQTGLETQGPVALGTGQLLAAGAAPIAPTGPEGEPQLDRQGGVLVLARAVATPPVVAQVAARTGAEATILVGGEAAASTLGDETAESLAAAVGDTAQSRIEELGGIRRFLTVTPLETSDGTVVGALALALDAGSLADIEDTFTRRLFLTALGGLLLAVLLAGVVTTLITRPIRALTGAAERVADGDLSVRSDLEREDEVGRLSTTFDTMTEALAEREAELTDAAATEATLRARLEIVTASMGEALLATDSDGAVTTVNPAALELLGADRDDIRGRGIDEVLRGVDDVGTPLPGALGSPRSPRRVATRATLVVDGRRGVPVAATAAPLAADGDEPLGRVYVLRDISGEVEVERMKTEFLSNISHELRTPLTPIRGYAEVLRKREIDPERTAAFAESILEATGRLERVIGMLVDFAALEAGRMSVEPVPTRLGEVVDETLDRWRDRCPERRFTRYLSSALPPVQVDPDLLDRVFEELVDNAVKFSDGPVRIVAERADEETVRVTVRDRGRGIPPDRLEGILTDFHQADGSATREIGGLGLGLAIVRRILERFDAEMEIESGPEVGTDVHLLLPVADR